jgi:hypothetical protein
MRARALLGILGIEKQIEGDERSMMLEQGTK